MNELKAGDVVQLKSGGPYMTVGKVQSDGSLFCIWFDGNKKINDAFNVEAVVKIDK